MSFRTLLGIPPKPVMWSLRNELSMMAFMPLIRMERFKSSFDLFINYFSEKFSCLDIIHESYQKNSGKDHMLYNKEG